MKKISLLFILLAIVISFSANAQLLNEIYRNDYCKIKGIYNGSFNALNISQNFDDEGLYIVSVGDTTYRLLFNDALDLVYEQKFTNYFYVDFKLNNNLYAVIGNLIGNANTGYNDSINLFCYDSIGNTRFKKTIMTMEDDTIKWNNYRTFVLDNKNILVALSDIPINGVFSSVEKLIKIDTLGNVLESKIFYHNKNALYLHLCEVENNILFGIDGNNNQDCVIYFLNKSTLEIEDSIKGYNVENFTKINDSIIAYSYGYGSGTPIYGDSRDTIGCFNLMNINAKKSIPVGPYNIEGYENGYFVEVSENYKIIDFNNPDSIYACYTVRGEPLDPTHNNRIEIVNFNINGDTNFTYRIRYEENCFKQIQGIKATTDGGVIIAAYSGNNDSWLIKFKPSGLIGLTNVQTGEKESIRVFPNPARDYVNVDIECTNFKTSYIELLDMQGRIVKTSKLKAKQGNRIDVSSLSSGAYTYNVSLNGKTISGKIIIGK